MRTTHRDYAEVSGDFHRLCRFTVANAAALRTHSTWSLGRVVDWKYGLFEEKTAYPSFCDRNAHLWFDAFDELAGYAISENGDAGFAIITAAGYRFLFEEMLRWALDAWGGRSPRSSIEITARQEYEAEILERHGFVRRSTFGMWRFDLNQDLAPRIPLAAGFSIVDMAAHPDYRAQRLMRADGFGGKETLSEEELRHQLAFYNHMHQGPIYHAETDLCVMAPDGDLVAGCEALIDARNAEADVERVCTRAAFRRRGLARAAIVECLHRLQDMGMRAAYIAGYSREAMSLYGSLGATSKQEAYVYERGDG